MRKGVDLTPMERIYVFLASLLCIILMMNWHDNDDNVTKRPRVSPRLLTFSPTEKALPADAQIIGALNGMEIVDPINTEEELHDQEMLAEIQEDDMLGEDLMEMEAGSTSNVQQVERVGDVNARVKLRTSSSYKSGGRTGFPLGLQNKKACFFRRGSPQENNTEEPQVLSLGNICLLDGSWTSTDHFSGCGWVWMDNGSNIQLMGTRNITRRESALHSELEALRWAMENMLQHSTCQSFGTDCKDLIAMLKEPHAWLSFATELERIEMLQICLPEFSIIHVPRARNQTSDFLAKTARSFHRELLFIGCSIPV
ncbi:hypothetical protein IGI04_006997, partial [Brassica rapa subsp. trilocularis]